MDYKKRQCSDCIYCDCCEQDGPCEYYCNEDENIDDIIEAGRIEFRGEWDRYSRDYD